MSGLDKLGLGVVMVAIVGLSVFVPFHWSSEKSSEPIVEKRYHRDIAEGLVLNRHGVYGVDLVRCGKCSVRKKKRGLITFGGMNELVLEDLKVVLPQMTNGTETARGSNASAHEVLAGMGVGDSFLKSNGVNLRFSALLISGLEVSQLVGTNVVEAFRARRGEAVREGLRLEGCEVAATEGLKSVGRALLRVKPQLRLEWSGGQMDLMKQQKGQ